MILNRRDRVRGDLPGGPVGDPVSSAGEAFLAVLADGEEEACPSFGQSMWCRGSGGDIVVSGKPSTFAFARRFLLCFTGDGDHREIVGAVVSFGDPSCLGTFCSA